MAGVPELRLVLTVQDYDTALRLYRDALDRVEVGRRVAGPVRPDGTQFTLLTTLE